jgi:hypothetical protein
MTLTLICALIGTQQLLTAEESKAVAEVIASVAKAGFPEAKQAAIYSGKVFVRTTFDPEKDPCPLPSHLSDYQAGADGGKTTYGFTFDGIHFKLADGRWLFGLAYAFKPGEDDSVKFDKAEPVDPAKITVESAKAHPFDAKEDADEWIARLAPAHRDRAIKALDLFVPVSHHLKLENNDWAPAILLLHAAGWADAPAGSLAIADHRSRQFWQQRPWIEPDFLFDPQGKYPMAEAREKAWKDANKILTPEPPATALRRALFRWCFAQILADEPMIPAAAAAAACKAALDPRDPQKHAARIDAALAASKLPVSPKEGADLATRLASWEARTRQPRMKVTTKKKEDGGATMSTSFEMTKPAYEPDKGDLDALVALLGDERPSRFFDFSGARAVGDNAWRALATLLEADPRELAGHAVDRPWTAAERKAASTAVQRWWKDHRAEHVGK